MPPSKIASTGSPTCTLSRPDGNVNPVGILTVITPSELEIEA